MNKSGKGCAVRSCFLYGSKACTGQSLEYTDVCAEHLDTLARLGMRLVNGVLYIDGEEP